MALWLARAQSAERWLSDFGASESLHIHFYHGNLTVQQLNTHARNAKRAIDELLILLRPGS